MYSQYRPASTESGKRFNSKYTTKRQMANHAGNRGTDQYYFSALQCQRLCLLSHLKVREREHQCEPFWLAFVFVSCEVTTRYERLKECIKVYLCYTRSTVGGCIFDQIMKQVIAVIRPAPKDQQAFKSERTTEVGEHLSCSYGSI